MSKYKLFFVLVIALCSLLPTLLYSQVDTAWVRFYDYPTAHYLDQATSIALDSFGNIYVFGFSSDSTIYHYIFATIKYNSLGDTVWVRRCHGYNQTVDDIAVAIKLDGSNNVYITGRSSDSNGLCFKTVKYNTAGVEQWQVNHQAVTPTGLFVDASGNVFVTGYENSSGTANYLTVKYNMLGIEQWVKTFNGTATPSDDQSQSIAVDMSGNVCVTGWSQNNTSSYDYTTIKYNSSGDTQWVRHYNGPANNSDYANALTIDNTGNVYVTGRSVDANYDIATIKYNSSGQQQWVTRYNGTGNWTDCGNAVAVDNAGNVYVTGYSIGTGTTNNRDIITIKYNSAGIEQWTQRYNGYGTNNDEPSGIVIDNAGNVYVTGYTIGASGYRDCITLKYNSAGIQQWLKKYNGLGNNDDGASAIAVNNAGNVYITGFTTNSTIDYLTIKYVQMQGVEEEIENCKLKIENFTVFPNPAKTFFVVRLRLDEVSLRRDEVRLPQLWSATTMSLQAKSPILHSKIRMYDVTGKLIKVEECKGEKVQRISLDGIKNGIYFVKVGNEIVKEKLVVTK